MSSFREERIANAALSIDGFGSRANNGFIQANIPAGSTIRKAYLYAASIWNLRPVYGVTFNGTTLLVSSATILGPDSNPATTVRWDVTSIIASSFTGGLQNFNIVEDGDNDGEVLVVAYSNPSTQGFTSVILDGELSTGGDTVEFNFASPYTSGDFLVSLASSYSLQPTGQFTQIDVTTNSTNNRRLTSSAGGQDDGAFGNGALITVGGIGDNPNNPGPNDDPSDGPQIDDEYYNLALGNSANPAPFILPGDTFLRLTTQNPSNDDNVFGIFITTSIPLFSIPEFPIIPDKEYQTEIQFSNLLLENNQGAEQRIVQWASPIRIFNLSRNIFTLNSLTILLNFHKSVKGSKEDFLLRDFSDYQATKNIKELGNGASTQGVLYPDANGLRNSFLLTKKYSCGGNIHYRPILYPDSSTLKIYVNGVEQLPTNYSVDTGLVVFNNPPIAGSITWEGDFKVLCHFEDDKLDYQPIVRQPSGNSTIVDGVFSVPQFILRESRIDLTTILPVDIFNDSLNHVFLLNLTKRATISPKFETNIITLTSGERKRFSRRNNSIDTKSLQQRKTLTQIDIEYLICLWLCSKGSGATFNYPDLVDNISIISRFNSESLSYQNQTPLKIYLLGELEIRRFSEGIVIDDGIDGNLSNPVLTICRCILIELTDGEKLGYTNFSQDLIIDGVIYRSRQALEPTALEKKLGIESDNEELRGAFSDDLTENLIFSNRFQEAKIITALVDWRNLPDSLYDLPDEQLQIGYVGEITSRGGETYTLENLTEASIKLRQSRDEKISPSCRWFFGQDNEDGTGCRKVPPTHTTTVSSVSDRRIFNIQSTGNINSEKFKWGKCTFVNGKNRSATYAIYQAIQQGNGTRIELFTGTSDEIAVGDQAILTAGCERTYNACKNDWNNVQNFGGIPSFGNFMKGNDFYLAPPKQS